MKNKKIIFVIIVIVVALLFIILPPLFRNIYKNRKVVANKDKLVCSINASDKHKITVTTKYKNNEVDTIDFIFVNNSKIHNGSQQYVNSPTKSVVLLNYYASLVGAVYVVNNNVSEVKLTNETYKYYHNNKQIKKVFSNYNTVRKYYESIGYSCK